MKFQLDNSGSVVIEFALIVPLLLIIALLSFDTALYLLDRQRASSIISSQIKGLIGRTSPLEIKADLEEILQTERFYRVQPQDPVSIYYVCLCGDESLSSLANAGDYPCSEPPRCQDITKSYSVISVDFSVDSSAFSFTQGGFLPSFKETVVIRDQ